MASKLHRLLARLGLMVAVAFAGLMPVPASAEEKLAAFKRSDGLWGYTKTL